MKLKGILFDIFIFVAIPVIVVGIVLYMLLFGVRDDDLGDC